MPRKQAARKHVPVPFFGLALPSLPFHVAPVPSTHPPSAATLYVGVIVLACRVVLTSIYRRVWAHQKAEGRRAETPAAAAAAGPSCCRLLECCFGVVARRPRLRPLLSVQHTNKSLSVMWPWPRRKKTPRPSKSMPCVALGQSWRPVLLLLVHPQRAGRPMDALHSTQALAIAPQNLPLGVNAEPAPKQPRAGKGGAGSKAWWQEFGATGKE